MSENGRRRCHFEFADLCLYPNERLLTKRQERIPLTPRVMDLLILLVENEGELVTKDALLSSVWPDTFVDESNVARTVSTLRKNLGLQESGSDFIETLPKLGYRFIAPVRKVERNIVDAGDSPPKSRLKVVAIASACLSIVIVIGLLFTASKPPNPVTVDGLTNVTNSLANDDLPSWSPDGTKIAFTSNRDGPGDIYVMNMDGSGIKRLTDTPAVETSSAWSPDGTKIVFDSVRDGNREVYIMNSDGSDQTRLTFNPTVDAGPVTFSPDGNRIAFARNASDQGSAVYNFDIYVMDINGSNVVQLTTDPEFDAEPVWSPDGSRIYFMSARDKAYKIFAIGPDGRGEVRIATSGLSNESSFAFTSDGRKVFCTGDTPEKNEFMQVYVMDADGSNRQQISTFADSVYRIAYSPQAGKFAVTSKRSGNFEIYTMPAPVFGN